MFVGLIDFAVEKNTLNLNFVGIRIPWGEVTQRPYSMHAVFRNNRFAFSL